MKEMPIFYIYLFTLMPINRRYLSQLEEERSEKQ